MQPKRVHMVPFLLQTSDIICFFFGFNKWCIQSGMMNIVLYASICLGQILCFVITFNKVVCFCYFFGWYMICIFYFNFNWASYWGLKLSEIAWTFTLIRIVTLRKNDMVTQLLGVGTLGQSNLVWYTNVPQIPEGMSSNICW